MSVTQYDVLAEVQHFDLGDFESGQRFHLVLGQVQLAEFLHGPQSLQVADLVPPQFEDAELGVATEGLDFLDLVLSEVELVEVGHSDGHQLGDLVVAEVEHSQGLPAFLHVEGLEVLDVVVVGSEDGEAGQGSH